MKPTDFEKMDKMETVDITPTWTALLPVLLQLARGDVKRNRESVDMAHKELRRMAQAADKYNELVNKEKQKPKRKMRTGTEIAQELMDDLFNVKPKP